MLLKVAVGIFVIAALFGVIVLIAILTGTKTPKFAVFSHGVLALSALFLSYVYIYTGHRDPILIAGVVLLTFAALGGLTMFLFDLSHKPISKLIAFGHPFIAVIGVGLLVTYFFSA